ncbi:MAG: cation diffusion facilitator family transporter [Bacteroidetes bacterium]|nr:cation diffusion facilitator family transporter [Bacteroidota bacterium]
MDQREKEIFRVTWTGFFTNLMLSAGKIMAGIWGQSGAMVADGIHSASDLITDVVVLVFVKLSGKPQDKCHDYGHGKYETLAAVIIGLALLGVGITVVWKGVFTIYASLSGKIITRPGMIALWAAVVSIVAKEGLYRYTVRAGKTWNSSVTIANAWHHRSDSFSSIGTLIGIGGAHFLGPPWRFLDPLAAVVVGVLIVRIAYKLMVNGVSELMEKSLSDEEEEEILFIILQDPAISDPHHLKTRRIGAQIAIEIHIRLDGSLPLSTAHEISTGVEYRLRERYGKATQVIVHIEPQK